MKQAKGEIGYMEENKNNIENTEEILSEVPDQSLEVKNVSETQGEESKQEDISYSYGERAGSGIPYQTHTDSYEQEMDTTPLTMGDWILTLLAAFIPCCGGIILYCYWAFAKKGNLHRRNFCRAALIIEAVLIILMIIFLVLVVIIGSVSYETTSGGYYYYGY